MKQNNYSKLIKFYFIINIFIPFYLFMRQQHDKNSMLINFKI